MRKLRSAKESESEARDWEFAKNLKRSGKKFEGRNVITWAWGV